MATSQTPYNPRGTGNTSVSEIISDYFRNVEWRGDLEEEDLHNLCLHCLVNYLDSGTVFPDIDAAPFINFEPR